eukprot:SAG31_NODE_13516_length_864_cov_1.070588_1_plen_82_part_10
MLVQSYKITGFPSTTVRLIHVDAFSISALPLAMKVPYFSTNSGHKNEKVTSYLPSHAPPTSASGSRVHVTKSDDTRCPQLLL